MAGPYRCRQKAAFQAAFFVHWNASGGQIKGGLQAVHAWGALRYDVMSKRTQLGIKSSPACYLVGAGVPACLGKHERLLIHSALVTAPRIA